MYRCELGVCEVYFSVSKQFSWVAVAQYSEQRVIKSHKQDFTVFSSPSPQQSCKRRTMAEGGMFPWKIQKIFRLPVADYSRTRESLPAPPEGMEWFQNKTTREWRLVKANEPELVKEEKHGSTPCVAAPVTLTPDVKPSCLEHQLPPRCSSGGVVDRLPQCPEKCSGKEDDWEFLSDRLSNSSSVFLHRNTTSGSVRSLTSMEGGAANNSLSSHNSTTLSVPFKIQRTASSSTIDSADGTAYLGPSGKGVLGVDYVEHIIMPTDTLQGICLAYKIGSTRLRQANHFSGNSLLLAPKKLVIPLSKKALRSGFIRVQDTDAKEYKLHAILAEFPDLSLTEAKA